MTGKDLKGIRTKAGLSAKFLATELGISPMTWSKYETGKIPVPRPVYLATRYLCQPVRVTAADQLVQALKEALEEAK